MKSPVLIAALLLPLGASAQTSASSTITPSPIVKDAVTLPYRISDEGKKLPDIIWGLDLAWISEGNVRRGVNFAGEDMIEIMRLSFQTNAVVGEDLQLSSEQKRTLDTRINLAKQWAPKATVNLNSDQEAGVDTWYHNSNSASQAKTYAARWVNLIAATKLYCEQKGLKVSSISPFNEPDYTPWNQGSKAEFLAICQQLRAREDMQGVALCGGNTLNDDQALSWYNYCKAYLDEGNTHQLAGSFDNFANFYKAVAADGKVGVGDELHNTMECMVGSEYGLTKGIWWGTCDHTRSQFMKASRGHRLGYAEHRNNWTAASIYRHPGGRVQAFGGTSERQAVTTTFRLSATDHDVFYNGQGPTREYLLTLPGGSGYQNGQTNAETCIDIQDGEDIMPPLPTEPTTYKFVNRASGFVIAAEGSAVTSGTAMTQERNVVTGNFNLNQQWVVRPMGERSGGDFSYYKIMNARDTTLLIDVLNWSLEDRGGLIAYKGGLGDNEQWYFEYAEDGWFYIRSRHSALCIEVLPGTAGQLKTPRRQLCQGVVDGTPNQQWRLIPAGITYNATAPAAPADLTATAQVAAVLLNWQAPADQDLDHYIIQRSTDQQNWYTIHNNVTTTSYTDNTADAETTYYYRVKAVDQSQNRSEASATASAAPNGQPSIICHLPLDGNLLDVAGQGNHGAYYGAQEYLEGRLDSALQLRGTSNYIQMPTCIANSKELTISLWVYWRGGSTWQRLFDFGTDTDHYCFLTMTGGSGPRLAIKNGGSEYTVSLGSSFGTNRWRHVAVSFSTEAITVYFDGQQVARNTTINIRPADFRPIYNYIGRSQFPADPALKAYIDDVRIYNYALSAEQVQAIANLTDGVRELPAATTTADAEQPLFTIEGLRTQPRFLRPGRIYIRGGHKILYK